MFRTLLYAWMIPLLSGVCAKALVPNDRVTFRVNDAAQKPDLPVFVTGDHPSLGAWDPGAIALAPASDGAWTRTFSFGRGTRLAYKFTRGTWTTEALLFDDTIPLNNTLTVTGDTVVGITVERWKDTPVLIESESGSCSVTFQVLPTALPSGATVYVTGNHAALGDWNPAAVPLAAQADGTHAAIIRIPRNTYLEYKVTLGSWGAEALRPDLTVPGNSWVVARTDTLLRIHVAAWGNR